MKGLAVVLTLFAGPGFAGPIAGGDLSDLPPADVVVLGEVHDNPVHHANQARAVAAIAPRALVFEMLTPAQVAALPADRADAAALARALGWADSGWPDFALYFPIFAAAPTARIYGGNLPRDVVRQAVKTGAAGAFGAGAARYGLDLPCPPPTRPGARPISARPIAARCPRRCWQAWCRRSACAMPHWPALWCRRRMRLAGRWW